LAPIRLFDAVYFNNAEGFLILNPHQTTCWHVSSKDSGGEPLNGIACHALGIVSRQGFGRCGDKTGGALRQLRARARGVTLGEVVAAGKSDAITPANRAR